MLGEHERSGLHLFILGASPAQKGRGRPGTMPSTRHEFSEAALTELLRALRARTSAHPDNPGLIASWPEVREDRMASACAELLGRGHPVFRVSIPSTQRGGTRYGWAVGATIGEPACQA
jgi:hypothetical protein